MHGRLNGSTYDYLKSLSYDRFESRVRLELGNGMVTRYRYDPATRRLDKLQAGKGSGAGNDLQDLAYTYDQVGNILSLNDTAPIPKSNEFGGTSSQNFRYDDLYRLIKADGVYKTAREAQTYRLDLVFDEIHNITRKTQEHKVFKGGGVPIAAITPSTEGGRIERATSYDWAYAYGQRGHKQPHAPTQIGNRTFDYDANGNQVGWQNLDNGTRRTIVWDEDNRIREVQDPKSGAAFHYDDQGERKLKKSQYGETAYITQFFTVRNGAIASTHVYAGTTRIATKLGAGTPVGKTTPGDLKGTGNISTADASLTEYVAPEETSSTTTTATVTTKGQAKGQASTPSPLRGEGRGEGQRANQATFQGQGLEHRSERANEVARNTEKNKHLNGGDPGGIQGAANSNSGGNSSNAGGNGGGNAWGRTGERGNSDHSLSRKAGEGRGEGGAQSKAGGQGNGGGGSATGGTGDGREFIYFYHPDHLGSSAYVTDEKAQRYEHLAYFPFGETWVQESTATWRVPYQYTAKEMDSETGLYYFGARYYDPRTSVWASTDPILEKYLPTGNSEKDAKLPGMGGAFNSRNLGLFSYAHQSPIKYTDPDGNMAQCTAALATGPFAVPIGGACVVVTGTLMLKAAMAVATVGAVAAIPGSTSTSDERAQSKTEAKTRKNEDGDGATILYHGTDFASARALLAGAPLNVEAALNNKYPTERGLSPVGFYLTPDVGAAEMFAYRRAPGGILQYTVSNSALASLTAAGAYLEPIPAGRLPRSPGTQLVIPPSAFPLFDELRAAGKIIVTPARTD